MRHPLGRSAVVQSAAPSALRAAHIAAADGLQRGSRLKDHEARVWHLAEAAMDLSGGVDYVGVMVSSWLISMTRAIWVIQRSMRRKLPPVIWVTELAVSA